MMPPLLWFGPVSTQHVHGTRPDGYDLHVLGCLGDGPPPQCADHAARWKDAAGRVLPGARRHFKIAESGPVVLAAFSAGGQIVKRTLLSPEDRADVAAVYLADATYAACWNEAHDASCIDAPLEGFVLAALDSIASGRPFVATASAGANGPYPSGQQTLKAIWSEVERRSGRLFADATADPLLEGLKPPVRAGRLNNVLFVDWGPVYKHGEHPTIIAPVLLPRALTLLSRGETTAPRVEPVLPPASWPGLSRSQESVLDTIIGASGALLGLALAYWILGRWKRS